MRSRWFSQLILLNEQTEVFATCGLAKRRRNALDSLPGFGRQAFERLENFLVRHPGAEVSPAIRPVAEHDETLRFSTSVSWRPVARMKLSMSNSTC